MGEFVRLEVDETRGVGTIRVDRPPMNALSRQVWAEIEETAREAEGHPEVGAVVVWGGESVFAAGADVSEFPELDHHEARAFGTALQRSLDTLARLPQVTIAAVHGYALGGGCELALACDLRFVAADARLGQPEILLGIIPGAGGTQRLPRLVGLSRAKDLVFSGRQVRAEEALRIGLADRVVAPEELYSEATGAAARYAAGPYALRLAKRALEDGAELPLDQGLRLERDLFAASFATEDARTGVESFLADGPGKARFEGR